MLDFHSHILPAIDDGAKDTDESIAMLKMLKEQGVNTVALTPHYIATDESPAEFLARREESFKELKKAIEKENADVPQLLLGAEVYFYPGLLKMDDIDKLRLQNTNMLLLEMPMARWSEHSIREIIEFANSSGINLVLAHIERYLKMQRKDIIDTLLDNDIMLQVNASFFNLKKTRRKALKMFRNNEIHFIGSDCHNTKYRPPHIKDALDVIREKFSDDTVNDFIKEQHELIEIM